VKAERLLVKLKMRGLKEPAQVSFPAAADYYGSGTHFAMRGNSQEKQPKTHQRGSVDAGIGMA
jgi:hypothetical protein